MSAFNYSVDEGIPFIRTSAYRSVLSVVVSTSPKSGPIPAYKLSARTN